MYEIINQPKYISIETYYLEQEKFINNIKKIPGIVSIGNFGSVGAPGLSDLDFIVIVEDDFNSKYSINLSCKKGLSILDGKLSFRNIRKNKDKYNNQILLHGPIVISKSQLKELNYIVYAPKIETLYGEIINEDVFIPQKNEFDFLKLMYLIDFSSARLTHFTYSEKNQVLDKRGWLTRTWSLTHSKNICDSIGITLSIESINTINQIKSIREQWLIDNTCSDNNFVQSFINSKKLLVEILTKAIDVEKKYLNANQSTEFSEVSITLGDKKIICSDNIITPFATTFSTPYKVFNKQKTYYKSNMPYQYALHLQGYGFDLKIPTKINVLNQAYIRTLHKRGLIAKQHREFLFKKHMTFAMGAYLGLPIPPYNLAINLIDKINWKLFS